MSLRDVLSSPGTLVTAVAAGFVAILAYIGSKSSEKAKTAKTKIEKEELQFELEGKKETRNASKISDLTKRIDEQDRIIGELKEQIRSQDRIITTYTETIEELRSQINLNKTVNS